MPKWTYVQRDALMMHRRKRMQKQIYVAQHDG